jgi:2-phospho-L-lactate guanylyltransferase
MPLWAIIPIKPLRRGKSRLAGSMTSEEREFLNQKLLIRTVQCLERIPKIDQIAVISHDPSALHISRELGVKTIQETRNTEINNALRKATQAIMASNASKLLIVPADLPLILPEDISDLLSKSNYDEEIIISPDNKMCGTNALFVNPIGILDYEFGLWSFRKHIEQAQRKKIHVEIYNNDRIAFDLDLPEDLEFLRKNNLLDKIIAEMDIK